MNQQIQTSFDKQQLCREIQYNCDISDARDHGIYSMCSMVLKLRNFYKWEYKIEPWQEQESADLLDWIDGKENYWQDISNKDFQPINVEGKSLPPDDVETVNKSLIQGGLYYGAGHGRSMKSIFFLAEVQKRSVIEGCPVVLLGTELAREMASPPAMVQEGQIIIRTDPLRFFLWDHIQELRSSCRSSFQFTLQVYGLLKDGALNQLRFKDVLNQMVEQELDLFIYHEVGELLENSLSSDTLGTIIGRFPSSVIEFVCRAVKDILADTHPLGVLTHIGREHKASSLGLYVSFLDGIREELFPEMAPAWKSFLKDKDWLSVDKARIKCRERTLLLAEKITAIAESGDGLSDKEVQHLFNKEILGQLGLAIPET